MEDLGGIINVGVCIEDNLKDECSFELTEDMVLMVQSSQSGFCDKLRIKEKCEDIILAKHAHLRTRMMWLWVVGDNIDDRRRMHRIRCKLSQVGSDLYTLKLE